MIFFVEMRFVLLIFFLFTGGITHAQKVGLVLSGGAAKGLAHIGVLKALEENEIPIDYIVGTSMGGIIAVVRVIFIDFAGNIYTDQNVRIKFTGRDIDRKIVVNPTIKKIFSIDAHGVIKKRNRLRSTKCVA